MSITSEVCLLFITVNAEYLCPWLQRHLSYIFAHMFMFVSLFHFSFLFSETHSERIAQVSFH